MSAPAERTYETFGAEIRYCSVPGDGSGSSG